MIQSTRVGFLSLLVVTVSTAEGRSQLSVYEGFNNALANGATFNGAGTAGTSSFGWSTTTWTNTNPPANRITYRTSGLAFPGLATAPGAIQVDASGGQGVSVSRTQAPGFSGTYFASYLFQNTTTVTGTASTVAAVFGGTDDTVGKVVISPRARSTATAIGGVRLNSGGTGTSANNTGTPFVTGATYLTISKIDTQSTPGSTILTDWVLNDIQFAAFKAAGSTETFLNVPGAVTQTGTATRAFTANLTAGTDVVTFYGFDTNPTVFDEFRMGGSIESVTPIPVPEPTGVLALAVGGLIAATIRRRRNRIGSCEPNPSAAPA